MVNCENRSDKEGRFFCKAKNVNECTGEACGFYITPEQAAISLEKAHERIRSLPAEAQRSFADKYYQGKMPWVKNI